MVMLISWIMIWPSAVMMDCSFSSSICGLLALFSPCISGKVWISCWCETTYMVYQGQYPLMSGPEPCQENLFCRFSLRSEEHTSELQSRLHLVCRLLLEKKKNNKI